MIPCAHSGVAGISHRKGIEEALCFGWIDGPARARNAGSWSQRFTPRSPRSDWSKINCDLVDRLVQQGLTMPAEAPAVDLAKRTGARSLLADAQNETVPDDLRDRLEPDPQAAARRRRVGRCIHFPVINVTSRWVLELTVMSTGGAVRCSAMTNDAEQTSPADHSGMGALRNLVSRRQLFALAGGAALLSACSSGSSKSAATTTVETTKPTMKPTKPTATTAAETATTAETTTTVAETTTTVAPDPVQPLTGLPLDDPALLARVALVVKVSNDKRARPQTGLNDPDIIFETWGSGPTRFATIWHSRELDFVGPIRSCREQDVNLVGEFNRAVFACSGGNGGNIALLRNSDLLLITEGKGPGWELDPNRGRPHKTHANTALLRSNAGPDRTGPTQQFRYRAVGEAATAGNPMSGFDLQIQQVFVQWRYDATTGKYMRDQDNKPHLLADKAQVSTENVIIAFLDYEPSHTDGRSPDGQTTGTNPALIFTGGQMIIATWSRDDRLNPFAFTEADGTPVLLTPGRTFIELPNSGKGSFVGNDKFTLVP